MNPLDVPANQQRKAILAALIAGLGSLGTALAEMPLTAAEGVAVALAAVVAYAGVFEIRNAPPTGQ